jgi:hypothetical protein
MRRMARAISGARAARERAGDRSACAEVGRDEPPSSPPVTPMQRPLSPLKLALRLALLLLLVLFLGAVGVVA